MILAVGVDTVEIARIEKAVQRERFVERVFTEEECEYCAAKTNPYPSFAARFAAKEATSKALGTGIGKISWREIETVHSPMGKPEIKLWGAAAEIFAAMGATRILLSLSHDKERAIAFVIIEKGR